MNELDKNSQGKNLSELEVSHSPLITMANDSLSLLSFESANIVKDRYGVDGVSLTNLEDLYDPYRTGILDML